MKPAPAPLASDAPVRDVKRWTTQLLCGMVTFTLDGNPVEVAFLPVGPHTVKYCGNLVSTKIWNVANHSMHTFNGMYQGTRVKYTVEFTKLAKLLELSSRRMTVLRNDVVIYHDDGTVGLGKG